MCWPNIIITPLAHNAVFLLGYKQLIMPQTVKITLPELAKLAQLTALQSPSGAAAEKLCEQLSQIISYVSQVQEAGVADGEGTINNQVRLRPDTVNPDYVDDKWLDQVARAANNLITVASPFAHAPQRVRGSSPRSRFGEAGAPQNLEGKEATDTSSKSFINKENHE